MSNVRWFNDKQVRDARRDLENAKEELDDYGRHQRDRKDPTETPEYLRLNHAVNDARDNLRRARP